MVVSKKILLDINAKLDYIQDTLNILAASRLATEQPMQTPKMSMTTQQIPDKTKEDCPLYTCSVCGKQYHNRDDCTNGYVRPDVALPQFTDYGANGRHLLRYCSFNCCEKISQALSFAKSGAPAKPYQVGPITH
jgi:hypothetical protein